MRTVGITGGTGFIGSYLTQLLEKNNYRVIVFTHSFRNKVGSENISYAYWDPARSECDIDALQKVGAMIHLAGEGIADKRWTDKRKQEITQSRVQTTNFLVRLLTKKAIHCKTLISASAIGFYGPDRQGFIPFKEDSASYNDFLANVCALWEAAAEKAEHSLRTIILRFGIVMGKEKGAFAEFVKPTSFGIAPILGSGKQVMSWIHVNDLANMILFALENEKLQGIYNAVAPYPITQKQLMRSIAKIKSGIIIPVPVPAFLLNLMLGEMSTELLKSCTVSADKIQQAGFSFQYGNVDKAVKAILGK
ncbi:MAG TPA: TIGR01777 family oxidoreductase [Flavipsychrobacter sp.]|nr:TIGR01777 family oxidoreductase [Flavipsychrobacter sp.]